MKRTQAILLFLALTVFLALGAQDKVKPDDKTENKPKPEVHPTPLKVQVVCTEFEDGKKTKSLPYSTLITADPVPGIGSAYAKIRIGNRVPLYTGKEGGLQYIDVGTNLDFQAQRLDDQKFSLRVTLERSWVQGDVLIPADKSGDAQTSSPGHFKEPVIGQYKTDVYLIIRDGQTVESTVATDPLSGKTLKIELTLNILK